MSDSKEPTVRELHRKAMHFVQDLYVHRMRGTGTPEELMELGRQGYIHERAAAMLALKKAGLTTQVVLLRSAAFCAAWADYMHQAEELANLGLMSLDEEVEKTGNKHVHLDIREELEDVLALVTERRQHSEMTILEFFEKKRKEKDNE